MAHPEGPDCEAQITAHLFNFERYYVYACINPFLIMPFNSLNIATGGL